MAETSRDQAQSAQAGAEKAQNSAEVALEDTMQLRSGFIRETEGVIRRTHRVKRSTEESRDSAEEEAKKAETARDQAQSAKTAAEGAKTLAEEEAKKAGIARNEAEIAQKGAQGSEKNAKNSVEELQKKPSLKIVPGDYNGNVQEANIELEGVGVIATFLEIGYFIKNDELYIRNHIIGNNTLIPKDFHFLKVVEDDLDSYKLAFCNNLGNLFFNYKKYDKEYANLPEEHKLIDLKYLKNAINIDLSKYFYHTHTPSFIIKGGELEGQSLENYKTDIYEIARNKKIGTLIDEFGYFEGNLFHYIDHHQGYNHHFQDLDVKIENYEGNMHIGDNTIHPINLDLI